MIDKKTEEFLTDPANLEAVLELEPIIPELKIAVIARFWSNVEDVLRERLGKGGDRWGLRRSGKIDDSYSQLAIVDQKYVATRQQDGHFRRLYFCYSCLTGRPEMGHYGVTRPMQVVGGNVSVLESTLIDALRSRGLRSGADGWWPGFRYLHEAGVPRIQSNQVEAILRLNEDNRSDDSLAVHTAGLLWELFAECHLMVEKVNDEWPYPEPKE